MILLPNASLPYVPNSIVSLVPSQTELLFELGLEARVTGITKFCIHPPHWKQTKTIIGGTKNVDLQKVAACKPDLVIANKEENVKEQVEALANDYPVLVTDVNNLEDALTMIDTVGSLTQTFGKSAHLITAINKAFETLPPVAPPLRTCYLIWREPYMTVGGDTFIHDMLGKAGFENLFAQQSRYPAINIETLQELNCELLLLSSEPYPFKQRHLDELQALLPTTKIALADGEMFSWYGSRLLHAPDYFTQLQRELK